MICRYCNTQLRHTFLDLGFAPPSNAYLSEKDLSCPELYLPLRVKVCDRCWLVQTEDYARPETLFTTDYAYFSSVSSSWLSHAKNYSEKVIAEFGLNQASLVVEIACNDGYLLKNFVAASVPCLGIEPTTNTAEAARRLGIPVLCEFFGDSIAQRLANQGKMADLIVGNNVYAHVPDINDFTRGLKSLLKPGGTITLEFPHLARLIEAVQFDTIYHEHFSYLSLSSVSKIFSENDLRIWRVEELSTHGGSLRVYGCHAADLRITEVSVGELLQREINQGLLELATYTNFQPLVEDIKNNLISFLIEQKRKGRKVVAYGAAAKGNTLLNFAGIKSDLLSFVCDAANAKQGRFMPGSHIPIVSLSRLERDRFDYLLILPWNIATEVQEQTGFLKQKGVRYVTAVPDLRVQ